MIFDLFEIEIDGIKKSINEKIEKGYKDKPLYTEVVKKIYNDNFIGLRFNKEVINFLDEFDNEMMVRNNLKHRPFSRIITSIDSRTGKNNFDYKFDFKIENDVVKVWLFLEINEKSFLLKTIKDMTDIFKEYLSDGDLKERMRKQTEEIFSNSVDESNEIFKEFYEKYKNDDFTIQDVVSYIGYKQHGIEYYYIEEMES